MFVHFVAISDHITEANGEDVVLDRDDLSGPSKALEGGQEIGLVLAGLE